MLHVLQVYAMLMELRIGEVAGFDLSVMDAYRWHPHIERIDLSRCVAPCCRTNVVQRMPSIC
jgi:hypothetical protein